jgi:hypothetical protein
MLVRGLSAGSVGLVDNLQQLYRLPPTLLIAVLVPAEDHSASLQKQKQKLRGVLQQHIRVLCPQLAPACSHNPARDHGIANGPVLVTVTVTEWGTGRVTAAIAARVAALHCCKQFGVESAALPRVAA